MAAHLLPRTLPRTVAALPLLVVMSMLAGLAARGLPTVAPGPAQCVQRGALDTPAVVVAAGIAFNVSGWAHDRLGVREIQVVSGGRVVARTRPGARRPDVAAALPGCVGAEGSGFSLSLPVGPAPVAQDYQVAAVNLLGRRFPLGRVALRFERPLGYLDTNEPIRRDGPRVVSGWAVAPGGPARVLVLANGRELARAATDQPRGDVFRIFPAWPPAARSGFHISLPLARLPRGRYPLTVRFEGPDGARSEIAGPQVINDAPLGKVVSPADRYANPPVVPLDAWVLAEDGVASVVAETEAGVALGTLQRVHSVTAPAAKDGATYRGQIVTRALPAGLHRLVVRVIDAKQRTALLPGPLVSVGPQLDARCDGVPRRLYYPGNHAAFQQGFPRMRNWRELVEGGCLEVGIRGRVEYLRTTRGRRHDYVFDADFPDAGRLRNGREMTGVSLRMLLGLARDLKAPLLITLDGGIWAGMSFSDPDIDVVDLLKQEEGAVQWNQYGRSEAADALRGLAGSLDNPLLARMMSLNRFNTRFRDYKKRNLQAAAREIADFSRAHPEIDITVNVDPDVYINPWFSLVQWYDYNPDTLRQFREWLFHLGPYADGGELAPARHEPRLTLESARRLAKQPFAGIDAVEPPRAAIDYGDPWQQIWSHFRRHLVAQHYADLAAWAAEAGLPPAKIYSAQAFIQADVAVGVRSRATGWTDQAGVSIEGAKPAQGHLGTTLYGPASRNLGAPREGRSLVDNIRRVDPEWGAVEMHPATIARPEISPTHAESYQTLLAIINGGARFLSPMWGSREEDRMLHPEKFRAYDVMEGSAFETQLAWWMLRLRSLPADGMLFPFGNEQVDSLDGWAPGHGTRVSAQRGRLHIDGNSPALVSPVWDGRLTGTRLTLDVAGDWPQRRMHAEVQLRKHGRLSCPPVAGKLHCVLPVAPGDRLEQLRLSWDGPAAAPGIVLDELSVRLRQNRLFEE